MEGSAQGKKMIGERDLRVYLDKCEKALSHAGVLCAVRSSRRSTLMHVQSQSQLVSTPHDMLDAERHVCRWDRKYWATYKVLDILQKVFYRSNPAREAFVEMCESDYVQKMTFDSYLYKVGDSTGRAAGQSSRLLPLSAA